MPVSIPSLIPPSFGAQNVRDAAFAFMGQEQEGCLTPVATACDQPGLLKAIDRHGIGGEGGRAPVPQQGPSPCSDHIRQQ